MRVVVIGAGVGGLTTAAVLARTGLDVTVLEAHVYPGGCAGTYFHQGYRMDAGATLAAGFQPGGPMDLVAKAARIDDWGAEPTPVPMVVHLPDGTAVERRGDEGRWEVRRRAFGDGAEMFWRWQERTADAMWSLALTYPAWPPQSAREAVDTLTGAASWAAGAPRSRLSPALTADAVRPVASRLAGADDRLRLFVDAQLLISAQTTSPKANALYGAAALDLPRRGTVHLRGGMGAVSERLADAVRAAGGTVRYKREARRVVTERGRPVAVEAKRDVYPADIVVANMTPPSLARLLDDDARRRVSGARAHDGMGWGAFTVSLGVDDAVVPDALPLHHQVVVREPLGEANSVFMSISPAWDETRSPPGRRAVTLSTHTEIDPWWRLSENDAAGYEARKAAWSDKTIAAAETVLPGLREASDLILPGTPVTFQRFTRRERGWVGGYPQTHLLRCRGPRVMQGLWMVGDSVFPGQSTAAVALGGLRVARGVLRDIGCPWPQEET
ncbi:MAG: phytoene desaturase family protein [Anaerolineae bacterium]|jgi:C-3',4' desaturase CrtD